jgi:hypothetical protein
LRSEENYNDATASSSPAIDDDFLAESRGTQEDRGPFGVPETAVFSALRATQRRRALIDDEEDEEDEENAGAMLDTGRREALIDDEEDEGQDDEGEMTLDTGRQPLIDDEEEGEEADMTLEAKRRPIIDDEAEAEEEEGGVSTLDTGAATRRLAHGPQQGSEGTGPQSAAITGVLSSAKRRYSLIDDGGEEGGLPQRPKRALSDARGISPLFDSEVETIDSVESPTSPDKPKSRARTTPDTRPVQVQLASVRRRANQRAAQAAGALQGRATANQNKKKSRPPLYAAPPAAIVEDDDGDITFDCETQEEGAGEVNGLPTKTAVQSIEIDGSDDDDQGGEDDDDDELPLVLTMRRATGGAAAASAAAGAGASAAAAHSAGIGVPMVSDTKCRSLQSTSSTPDLPPMSEIFILLFFHLRRSAGMLSNM